MKTRRPARSLFPSNTTSKDVDDELASHLEMRREELSDKGMTADEAAAAAARRFGDVRAVARECREIDKQWYRTYRRTHMWRDLRQDIGYAIRLLGRAPGFTALAVVTLALGIGATSATFSIVDVALLRPLPYPEPERLVSVAVQEKQKNGQVATLGPSLPDVHAWRRDGTVFSHLAIWRNGNPAVLDDKKPEQVEVMQISDQYLGVHGITPALGRDLTPDDARPGAPVVALLGHAFWKARFGSDPTVVGRVVRLNGAPVTIIGVLPQGFYPESQIWRSHPPKDSLSLMRGSGATVSGRLRRGVSYEQARTRLAQIVGQVDTASTRRANVVVESLLEETRAGSTSTTKILLAAVGSILLIGCINLAGLLLARGTVRQTELAIRASIGAGRMRIVRQLLTESLVLSLAGGAAGVLVAWIGLDLLVANIPLSLPENSPVTLNPRVLVATLGLTVVTGLIFGLLPALKLSRASSSGTLAGGDRRHDSALSRRSGQVLIAIEVALALVLLTGAGLMIRSFSRLVSVDLGFNPERLVTMEVEPVSTDEAVLRDYYPALVEAVRQLPGVAAVGAVDYLPLASGSTMTGARSTGEWISINMRTFVPGYFEAIELPVVEGRIPGGSEFQDQPAAAILNERAARELFPAGSALGRTFQVNKTEHVVAGIVRDMRHWGPAQPAVAEVYFPYSSRKPGELMLVVRPHPQAGPIEAQLRDLARGVGPRVVVSRIRSGSAWFDTNVVTPRQRTVLLGILGGLGLLLAVVGVLAMTSYAVARRSREIGVRMALGARPGEVVRTMLRDAVWPVAIGIAVGIGIATLTTKVIASFLFETQATEPATFGAVAAVVGITGCIAAWIPARRAAWVDPVRALRSE